MAKWLNLSGMFVGTIGIFFGFYYLSSQPTLALSIVTATTVGVVGLLAFIRHVVFHKQDAERMGWQTERPDWAYEVGFANLAFGVVGFVAVLGDLGAAAQAVVVLGYAVYLFQAAGLHAYRYFTDEQRSAARLWRSVIGTGLFAAMMTFFAVSALIG